MSVNNLASPVSDLPPKTSPGPSSTTRSEDDIAASTQYIYDQLHLLQADDIAQLGKSRQVAGQTLLSAQIGYWKLFFFNVKRYIQYLWDTWVTLPVGLLTGKLDPTEAISVLVWSAWTSSSLFLIFVWCTIGTAPPIVWTWNLIFGKDSNGLSLVNAPNPHLFECLTQEQANAGKKALGAVVDPKLHNPRVFDLDIAKLLLQLSALMYERDTRAMTSAIDTAQKRSVSLPGRDRSGTKDTEKSTAAQPREPGAVLQSLFRPEDVNLILSTLVADSDECEAPIKKFAAQYGICFATASELQTTSQAYCSLFWDPRSTWIIIAFKGTDPTSFDEWTTDFTATFVDCSYDIPGFNFVHKGFKDRILPDGVARQPFTSIAQAVKIVADELVKGQPEGTKVNLWFTGHSLGTAMASLAYAKALSAQEAFGPNALVRDAYVFATPVTVDIKSRLAFNQMMLQDRNVPRNLFRVTNRNDFVATGVPQFGDSRVESFGDDNLFNYSHLGIELYMKDMPHPSQVFGDAVRAPSGFKVHVRSSFPEDVNAKFRASIVQKGWVEAVYVGWAQYIPFLGRLAAHATTNYWEQLERIGQLPAVEKS